MTDRDRHRVQGLIAILEDRSLTDDERCRYALDAALRGQKTGSSQGLEDFADHRQRQPALLRQGGGAARLALGLRQATHQHDAVVGFPGDSDHGHSA